MLKMNRSDLNNTLKVLDSVERQLLREISMEKGSADERIKKVARRNEFALRNILQGIPPIKMLSGIYQERIYVPGLTHAIGVNFYPEIGIAIVRLDSKDNGLTLEESIIIELPQLFPTLKAVAKFLDLTYVYVEVCANVYA